jgi:aryl carrier-like protein
MNHKILLKRLMMMRTFTLIPEIFYRQALLKAVDLISKGLKVVQMMKMIIQWMELILP